MKKLSLALAVVVAAWSIQSCTEGRGHAYEAKTKVDINGLKFIKTAHESGLTEIAASKIAKQVSTNAEVKGFADMMITQHTELGKSVDSLALAEFVYIREKVNQD